MAAGFTASASGGCDGMKAGADCPLEPQVGDLVTNGGSFVWRVSEIDGEFLFFRDRDCRNMFYARKDKMKIIERDGKSFHWPESESGVDVVV